jgi:hypothetical protein
MLCTIGTRTGNITSRDFVLNLGKLPFLHFYIFIINTYTPKKNTLCIFLSFSLNHQALINHTEHELAFVAKNVCKKAVKNDKAKMFYFEFYLLINGIYRMNDCACYFGFFPTPHDECNVFSPELHDAMKWICSKDDDYKMDFERLYNFLLHNNSNIFSTSTRKALKKVSLILEFSASHHGHC